MKHDQQSFAAAKAYGDGVSEIVQRFMPMVRRLAWHLHGSCGPDIDPDDLMQAGFVALTECAQRHVGPNFEGFAAYAKTRVKGAMIDLLRRSAPLSRGAIKRRRELQEVQNRLWNRLGRQPEAGEVAMEMGIDLSELAALRAAVEPMHFESIDDVYSDSSMAFCDHSPDSFAQLVSQENREMLIGAIAGLPERLQLVIQLYFVEEFNLSEIASVLGVSVPRIHQLKDQALQRIKANMAAG
ncbi:sigma-70 family RNA polymerase sigma factor [Tsuneonella sp. CC-YZS046]|uniref:sigma-70 family RNA polymerase sigma factor n=1 Tax=Tsuneonella sp. CC-YZS046 TaxID=3042152 RepID=UPI002D768BEC|nr:sigma-70 family RNA polymerase sigma factor [Tsuneonella sp. CC-YZS046]WRO66816.1 sigma-70 family RNA polymerase sigma factor [Tsuneonella sp. CC-YZS046]